MLDFVVLFLKFFILEVTDLDKELVMAKLRWKHHPLRAFFDDIYRSNPALFNSFLNGDYSMPEHTLTGSISPSIKNSISDCPQDIPFIIEAIIEADERKKQTES